MQASGEKNPLNTTVSFYPLGDSAITIEFGNAISEENHRKVMALSAALEQDPFSGMIETVPAYTTLSVFFDLYTVHASHQQEIQGTLHDFLKSHIGEKISGLDNVPEKTHRLVTVPVCYGGESGPDLDHVASLNGLSPEEVISLHSNNEYTVFFIGFLPGFPYLGGMSTRIAALRKNIPAKKIPAGSVGIAGMQTGIYPLESPGGWQIIGRTPLKLFNPGNKTEPFFLKPGDRLRFLPVDKIEFLKVAGG